MKAIIESQVKKFYTEIWNQRNLDEIPNVLESDFEFRGSIGEYKQGHDGFKDYVNLIHSGLSDYHCEIEELVIENNKAFAKMKFSGIHTGLFLEYEATHQSVSWSAAALFTFNNDKIASLWVLGDLVGLQAQLSSQK